MHSKIFQLSTEPISKEEYIGTENIENGEMVSIDYAYDIKTEERTALIIELVADILPKGMFVLDTNCATLVYQGGFSQWRKEYLSLIRTKTAEITTADFYKQKSRFFEIVIQDSDIEITVLNSLEAFKEEGTLMHHCVWKLAYYAKEESLILSAHDHDGHRIETVEFSLDEGKVIQSRAVCNTNSEYHDRIINLVNSNAQRIMAAKATA